MSYCITYQRYDEYNQFSGVWRDNYETYKLEENFRVRLEELKERDDIRDVSGWVSIEEET